jgi:hypothetical protein
MFLNSTTGGQSVKLQQGSATTTVTIANGDGAIVFCDGSDNVTDLTATFNVSTVITASQPNITSLGTLTTLTVDDVTINGDVISASTDLYLRPTGDDVFMQGITSGEQLRFNLGSTSQAIKASDTLVLTSESGSINLNAENGLINLQDNTNTRGYLDLNTTQTIKLFTASATLNTTFSGDDLTTAGNITAGGNVIIADGGNIGSATDTDAIGITSGGIVSISATTASSSSSTGALTVAGGAGIAADLSVGDDLRLDSDSAVLSIGADADLQITHNGSSGDFQNNGNLVFDVSGDIDISAGNGSIVLSYGDTPVGTFGLNNQHFEIRSRVQDKQMQFKGMDATNEITALTLDMENAGNASFNGTVTANAGVVVDNITIDGTEIGLSSGDLTIKASASTGDVILDANGGDIQFHDGGSIFGQIRNESSDLILKCETSDKDIIFKGKDGLASDLTALTLSMANAGAATFNSTVTANAGVIVDNITIDGQEIDVSSGDLTLDVAGSINLECGGESSFIKLREGTTDRLNISFSSGNVLMRSQTHGADFVIRAENTSGSLVSVVWDPDMPSWRPNADDLYDLGNGSYRWRDIYAGNATIQTSDKNLKQDIESISEAETRVAKVLKGMLRKYRLISSVEEKGDEARIHFGVIAQDVQKAFEDEGLDAFKYAMLCKTTYWETGVDEERVVYNTAEEAPSNATEKSVLAVRYSELLAFIIAGL